MSFGAVQFGAVEFRTESRITIQRVSDIEMIAIKAAVESTTPAGTS
jgi:hypothetical protein